MALTVFGFAAGISNPTSTAPESIVAALKDANISLAGALVVGLILPLVLVAAIGAAMFWKRPTDPMVLLTSLAVITVMAAFTKSTFAAMSTAPELGGLVRGVFFLGFGSMVLLFALFPNGRSTPTWAWMAAPATAITAAALPEFPRALAMFPDRPADFDQGSWTLHLMFLFVVLTMTVVWQVYRYRKVSNHIERLQAKWVILPLTVSFAQLTLVFVLAQPVFELGDGARGWAQLSLVPSALLFPVGLAAAILRYRLYDIERIISRTLAYALVIGALLVVYATALAFLTQILPLQSDLAVAASTLAVAALFNPLRRRIQTWVDRRFNRTRYVADRELGLLMGRLRDTTGLAAVETDLLGLVNRTLQPSTLGLWIRKPGGVPGARDKAPPTALRHDR